MADVFEGFKLVVAGSFDDSSDLEPQAEVFTNNKMSWFQDNDCIQHRFPEAGLYDRLQIMIDNLEKGILDSIVRKRFWVIILFQEIRLTVFLSKHSYQIQKAAPY